jgi:hypothetical protein
LLVIHRENLNFHFGFIYERDKIKNEAGNDS